MMVSAGAVVPEVAGGLVHQHAVHDGAGVGLVGRPAREAAVEGARAALTHPHPLPVPRLVVARRPPALRRLQL